MKTTVELIEQISPRYRKVRIEKVDFLWEDFLQAVEKVINKLSDEVFAATSGITICYFIRKGEEKIYRSKTAKCCFFDDQIVEYEKEDICLGTKEMLQKALFDFKAKAEKDSNICADWFEVEDFFEGFFEGEKSEVLLDFKLPEDL